MNEKEKGIGFDGKVLQSPGLYNFERLKRPTVIVDARTKIPTLDELVLPERKSDPDVSEFIEESSID